MISTQMLSSTPSMLVTSFHLLLLGVPLLLIAAILMPLSSHDPLLYFGCKVFVKNHNLSLSKLVRRSLKDIFLVVHIENRIMSSLKLVSTLMSPSMRSTSYFHFHLHDLYHKCLPEIIQNLNEKLIVK